MSKTIFYNQPLAHRFGTALMDSVKSGMWGRLEIASAWVRQSGTRHLKPSLNQFLSTGGTARFTIGVDIENTSKEGLEDMLELQNMGDSETYIYHNEATTTFHPKVYLLQNDEQARLIVGSNNITEAGLFVNTEAGLQIEAANDDAVIVDAKTALASWRDLSGGFVKKLDEILLRDLVSLGYVHSESAIRSRRINETAAKTRRSHGQALFGRLNITAPPPPLTASLPMVGTVLLMRVRRASETTRRTQIQIPINVLRTRFFEGINELVSAHDGRTHSIVTATARGGVNTMKVELPEIDSMADPVVRLERTSTAITYQTFDANSLLGRPIMDALRKGLEFIPPVTSLTRPADPVHATWWRFI